MLLRIFCALLTVSLLSNCLSAEQLEITAQKIRAHVKYLSSDELEGRGVGTRGEKLATDYLAAQLQLENVNPAGENNTFFQAVPLVGMTTDKSATLTIAT